MKAQFDCEICGKHIKMIGGGPQDIDFRCSNCRGKRLITEDEYQEYQDLKDRGKTFQMICAGVHPQWKICDQKDKVLSNEKYCEYLDLKKWKADCDKEVEAWDEGYELHYYRDDNGKCSWCNEPLKSPVHADKEAKEWDKGICVHDKTGICMECAVKIFDRPIGFDHGIGRCNQPTCKKCCDQETLEDSKLQTPKSIPNKDLVNCPEENKHCSCRHIPYDKETLEDTWDETSVIQDIKDELADLERDTGDLYEDNKILHDIMDDLRGDVLTLQKDLKEKADEFYTKSWYEDVWTEIDAISKTIGDKIHTQKLINKIVQGQINELERVHTDSNSGSDGEKTLPKQTNKGTARKVKVRVEKSS